MSATVIVSAVRTPIGSIGGILKDINPERLIAVAMEAVIGRAGIEKEIIDEVIIGQAKQSTDAPNIARVASLIIGLPEHIPGYTVHRQCASGMQAILSGMLQIETGMSEVVLVGGVESMSTAPFYIRGARFGVGNGTTQFLDPNTESQPRSQPAEIYGSFNMIQTADEVARRYGISREKQDAFALQSQRRAIAAIDEGRFAEEIVPCSIPRRKQEPLIFDTDEYPRRDTNAEKLARLRPIFEGGTVTAGNASGRNDGASAMVLMSEKKAEALGLCPIARVINGAAAGVDPRVMGLGPVAAIEKLEISLAKEGITRSDIDLFEINEAFAAQSLACAEILGLDGEKLNVNGGAIALGHPLGCSGTRISTTLIHEMKRRGVRYGVASLCVAGGLGMAMAFENLRTE